MKSIVKTVAAAACLPLALSTTSCETIDSGNLLGAGLGGLAGYAACQLSGANDTECAALVLAGAAVGYGISEYLDARDQDTYQSAQAEVLSSPSGSTTVVQKQDADTGNTFSMQPTNEFQNAGGQPCRVIDTTYIKEGTEYNTQDTFCQGADGKWGPSNDTPT